MPSEVIRVHATYRDNDPRVIALLAPPCDRKVFEIGSIMVTRIRPSCWAKVSCSSSVRLRFPAATVVKQSMPWATGSGASKTSTFSSRYAHNGGDGEGISAPGAWLDQSACRPTPRERDWPRSGPRFPDDGPRNSEGGKHLLEGQVRDVQGNLFRRHPPDSIARQPQPWPFLLPRGNASRAHWCRESA
jgi:hypothetical protein